MEDKNGQDEGQKERADDRGRSAPVRVKRIAQQGCRLQPDGGRKPLHGSTEMGR